MNPRPHVAALALAAASLFVPALASAECSTAGTAARCIVVLPSEAAPQRAEPVALETMSNASVPSPLVQVGEVVPRGRYSLILNADYYGLPAVSDGWVYMRIGQDAFRVDWATGQVLERVTDSAAANF